MPLRGVARTRLLNENSGTQKQQTTSQQAVTGEEESQHADTTDTLKRDDARGAGNPASIGVEKTQRASSSNNADIFDHSTRGEKAHHDFAGHI